MCCKIKYALVFVVFSLFSIGQSQANFIVGDLYADENDSNIFWQYVGSFDLADGPSFLDTPTAYNGLDAAELVFGSLDLGTYALSTNTDDLLVNHNVFYDSFESVDGIFEGLESLSANNAGELGYDAVGDISAYVEDRAFPGQFINYVFTSVEVSEPPFIAFLLLIFALFYRFTVNRK